MHMGFMGIVSGNEKGSGGAGSNFSFPLSSSLSASGMDDNEEGGSGRTDYLLSRHPDRYSLSSPLLSSPLLC